MENNEITKTNNVEEPKQEVALTRQQKIENFLLNPDKEIFNSLQEFNDAINYIKELVGNLDLDGLDKIQGEDGKSPVLGIDYLTDEDLDKIDQYIQDRVNASWSSYPTKEEINSTIINKVNSEVAKIPRVKGDPGIPGKKGEDGSPDTAEQILEKLRSLPKNKRINVSDIRGLQAELNRIAQDSETSIEELRSLVESFRIKIPAISGGGGITDIDGLIEGGTNITINGSGTLADPFVINASGGAAGDVVGPASATDGNIPLYDGATGKLIKNSTYSPSSFAPALTSDENYVTDAEKTAIGTISGKEDVVNKTTSIPTDGTSDTKYPSAKAVKDYADGLVAGLLDYRGAYNASVNTFPASGGSGSAGAVMKGDTWVISVAGTLGGVAIQVGDWVIANVDTPGQTTGNWDKLNTNLAYVPEDVANKENTTLDNSTSKYPTNRLTKEYADGKVADSITDGVTTIAPSQNAVFDALSNKAPLQTYPKARVYLSADQTIPNAFATTVVNFDTESYDTNENYSSYKFTASVAGIYNVYAKIYWVNAATAKNFYTIIRKNGSNIAVLVETTTFLSSSDFIQQIEDTVELAVNDYIDVVVLHNSVGNVDIDSGVGASVMTISRMP